MTKSEKSHIDAEVKLYVKNEADRARNQVVAVLGFVTVILGILGTFGIIQLNKESIREALLESGVDEITDQANIALSAAEAAQKDALNLLSEIKAGKPDFDSGWKKAKNNESIRMNHSIGEIPRRYTVLVTEDPTSDLVHLANQVWVYGEEPGRGIMVTHITKNSMLIRTGSEWLFDTHVTRVGPTRVFMKSGFIRVLSWR